MWEEISQNLQSLINFNETTVLDQANSVVRRKGNWTFDFGINDAKDTLPSISAVCLV